MTVESSTANKCTEQYTIKYAHSISVMCSFVVCVCVVDVVFISVFSMTLCRNFIAAVVVVVYFPFTSNFNFNLRSFRGYNTYSI